MDANTNQNATFLIKDNKGTIIIPDSGEFGFDDVCAVALKGDMVIHYPSDSAITIKIDDEIVDKLKGLNEIEIIELDLIDKSILRVYTAMLTLSKR